MSISDFDLLPPSVPLYATATLATLGIKVKKSKKFLNHLVTNKAMDED